ncbi:MAG: hypothetical protein JWL76_1195 [Thermoleophilia bacterium]|nr:hypothetical protein [Thermoleophilia bacterium]
MDSSHHPAHVPTGASTSAARRYAPVMGAFSIGAGLLTHVATRRGRTDANALELTEAALATFFIARMVAKEKIGAVVREPFVQPAPGTDPADAHADAKQPVEGGIRGSIGELILCTRCLGPWAAAAVTFGNALAPQHGRVATRLFALAGANILAQAAQTNLAEAANRAVAQRDALLG